MFEIRTIDASDGYPLQYYVWGAKQKDRAIFLLHGFMSHSLWLESQLKALGSSGFKVVGIERRGAGINRRDLGDAPSAQQLLEDIDLIIAREATDMSVYVFGWCLGGVIALNYLHFTKKAIEGLILSTPSIFPQEALIERAKQMGAHPTGDYSGTDLPLAIQEDDFTRGPMLADFILRDELRTKRISVRFYEIQKKMAQSAWAKLSARKVPVPVLLIIAEKDVVVDNRRTISAFSAIENCVIRRINAEHGIQFEKGDELTQTITEWLSDSRCRDAR
jgi:alpha-beta hydrolase superfamily lysophospholipase